MAACGAPCRPTAWPAACGTNTQQKRLHGCTMDVNMKKVASGAGLFFTRAVQFTEEKLGQAEQTELDGHFDRLVTRAEATKLWTERIFRQTEVFLRPNPSVRMEDFLYGKLDHTAPRRPSASQLLGRHMENAAGSLGLETPYGSVLLLVGGCEQRLGRAECEFSQAAAVSLLRPLRDFLETDWSLITRERRLLENRRLDLDTCKARLKRAKAAETKAAVNHLQGLHGFVEAQATYYKQCHLHMEDLQNELTCGFAGSPGGGGGGGDTLQIEEEQAVAPGTRVARVLYDYDAADSSELSLYADQLITVYTVPGMDSDWLVGERANDRGRVPVTYLELLS
ncbi:unnamed protein product [Merluccius merluccius]